MLQLNSKSPLLQVYELLLSLSEQTETAADSANLAESKPATADLASDKPTKHDNNNTSSRAGQSEVRK